MGAASLRDAQRYLQITAGPDYEIVPDDSLMSSAAKYFESMRHASEVIFVGTSSKGADFAYEYRERFTKALADDLNTPQALAVVWDVIRTIDLGDVEKAKLLTVFDTVLGLGLVPL